MSPRWFPLAGILAVLSVAVVGCKKAPPPSVGSAAPKVAESGPPVGEQEAEEFGWKVATAFNTEDPDALVLLVQAGALYQRSIADLNLTAGERKELTDAISGERVCKRWVSDMKGFALNVLRSRTRDGRRSVLLRAYDGDHGVNYLEFMLVRGPDGQVACEDVYSFYTGETFSQLYRRELSAYLPEKFQGAGQSQQYRDHLPDIERMREHRRNGDTAKAKAVFDRLPPAVRNDKHIQLIGFRLCEDDEYLQAIERFRQRHPKDATLLVLDVDYFALKKDARGLRECLWRLDEAVGGDPTLRLVDARYHLARGDHAETRRLAGEVLKLDPALRDAYWVLIDVALAEDDHPETMHLLKAVTERCNYRVDVPALKGHESYKRFVTSKEYRELCRWYERRAR